MIRVPLKSDQSYVCATWMRSARAEALLVNRILDHDTTRLLVASADGDEKRIHGWVVYGVLGKVRALHYVYVRDGREEQDKHRGHGIGRALMTKAGFDLAKPVVYTGRGPDAGSLLARYQGVFLPVEEVLR